MERRHTISVPLIVAAAVLAGMATVVVWLAFPGKGNSVALKAGTPAGTMSRLAEDSWNGDVGPREIRTDSNVPEIFYNNKVKPPKDYHALVVTFSATSDQHGEGRLAISCLANNSPCDAYVSGEDPNPGAVVIGNHGGFDWHDNAVSQSWCVKNPTAKPVRILLGIDNAYSPEVGTESSPVFFEHANVTIDAFNLDACNDGGFFFEEIGPLAPVHH